MEDKLPKTLCDQCCKKLEAVHNFATMAVRNQDKLNKLMTDSSNHPSADTRMAENKGLLHTYLTKGMVENKQCEDMEEVEVKVDPMLFLEYNSDQYDEDEDENLAEQEQNHQETQPTEKSTFECSICLKSFHSEFTLQNHTWCHIPKNKRVILNNHNNFYVKSERDEENVRVKVEPNDTNGNNNETGGELKFGCPICGKTISTKGNLKVHLETHRPKGKYACDICGRIFKTQCNLHRHKEYHTGVQFTCGVCGRVYPTNSTLRAHSITHSDLRPHKCPLCDKTFKRNQDLKFHINQHTGARPYQCPYCPKAFASSGNCFSHRKRMHPMEVERDRERAAKIMR